MSNDEKFENNLYLRKVMLKFIRFFSNKSKIWFVIKC